MLIYVYVNCLKKKTTYKIIKLDNKKRQDNVIDVCVMDDYLKTNSKL